MLKFVIVARTPRWSIRVKLYTGKAVGVNDVCGRRHTAPGRT